jgi:hypothetical protein
VTGWWFSPGPPVFSTNKVDHHNITEILLKVSLNIITLTLNIEKGFLRKGSFLALHSFVIFV